MESFNAFIFAGLIGMKNNKNDKGFVLQTVLSYFSFYICMLILPILLVYLTSKEKIKLERKKYEKKFGYLYRGIYTHFWYSRTYNLVYVLKNISFFLDVIRIEDAAL